MIIFPLISKEISNNFPSFRAYSIYVEASKIVNYDFVNNYLQEACNFVKNGNPFYKENHLKEWHEAFKKFGANPKKTPCSADALIKRVLKDGSIPSINPIVDIYNAISIKYAVPVGGENFEAYVGTPKLKISNGAEVFDTIKNGNETIEYPNKGEVIWTDDKGVTCRRWNWRQCIRTRLSENSKKMWFIIESMSSMPLNELENASNELITMLTKLMPNAKFESKLITA